MKKALKIVLIILAAVLVMVLGLILALTITEYRPGEVSDAIAVYADGNYAQPGETITVLSWNIGYAGLGQESDFFMDGGKGVRQSETVTRRNLGGIKDTLEAHGADIYMLQETDISSKRSYGINEAESIASALRMSGVFAYNYNCAYVPFPLPTIGRVQSGLLTLSAFPQTGGRRISLPCPFSWPVSTANLKRCLLASYIDLPDTDKKLVVVNLHLEAYDDGEGKAAQTRVLRDFIENEYANGNYVVAGGDFNQTFPGTRETYPNMHPDLWDPGLLEYNLLPDDWSFAYDRDTPTCRLLNQAYDPSDIEGTQYYIIDGFILSPNVELVSVAAMDEGFQFSDHNPVKLEIRLK